MLGHNVRERGDLLLYATADWFRNYPYVGPAAGALQVHTFCTLYSDK